MKHHIISSEVSKDRITNWFMQAEPVTQESTWTETRRAVNIGEHIFLIEKEQIFQCLHCGTYDPQWSSVEVLIWLEENMGVKPYDLEIKCSLAGVAGVALEVTMRGEKEGNTETQSETP